MVSRKLAAILFADIVGYTAIMQRNEKEGLRKVKRFRVVLEEKVSRLQGEILQYYGDGSLVIFSSGIAALQCAREIQEALNDKTSVQSEFVQVPLRIGIHIGDIVVEEGAIFGDGVNLASRIESLGIPGAVLFSYRLLADLKSHPGFHYVSLGAFLFKNVDEPMEVFALANNGFPVPKQSEIKGKTTSKTSKSNEVSIAVLPFEDMSSEKDQEYFADGIAEEILNTLARLNELKIVGRTSSFSFKNKQVTIAEIGSILNVTYVLEGSVRRHGDRVRITAQLIKVEDGFHVWSQKYNEDFTDIFKIQDAVAQNIGKVLLEILAPEQIDKLKASSNQNSEAYGFFLRAKHNFTNRFRSTLSLEDLRKSEELFLAAIKLDPNYALAHAGLANLYDTYVFYGISATESPEFTKYNQLRIQESERAYELDPTLAYVNEVRGHILLNSLADLKDVYRSYMKAYELNPQNPDILLALMDVYVRRGLMYDALTFVDAALTLDPLHTWALAWKTYTLGVLGDFDTAIRVVKTSLEINPEEIILLVNLASFYSFLHDKDNALATYEKINHINPEYLKGNPYYQIKIDLLEGRGNLPDRITGQPSAAILPIGNVEMDYLSGDPERFENGFRTWWSDWKEGRNALRHSVFFHSQGSIYLHLQYHPIYHSFKDKPWFREILNEEKEKYNRFYEAFIRPDQLLA